MDNIIHIIRDEMKTNYNNLRDEMKTNYNNLRDEIKNIRDDMKWFMGTMIGAIVLISIAIVGGLGWVHNHHLKKDNTMSVDIVKNEKEIQEVKAEVKTLAQK